ncbi:MAG: YqhA family protein [Leptolyngbya sp. SIOISBB]|nr:YqhA family protein [Leptolyngbya sp. SIOISBB]
MPRILAVIKLTRLISVLAILSSLLGALIMFWIGTVNTFKVILLVGGLEEPFIESARLELTELATIELLECLDDFIVGLAFLYFAYGIYALFIQLGRPDPNLPSWLAVSNIGTLKKTLLEVLVVLLTVIFVKGLLERLSFQGLEWTYLVIPLSILAIAASTRLLQFDNEEEAAPPREAEE